MGWSVIQRPPGRLLAAGLLVAMLTVSGCGQTSPVCSDVDAVKSSASALTDVQVEKGALAELEDKFAAMKQDFAQLKSEAKSEFGSQIDAVTSASASFSASLDAAIATPTGASVAAVAAALQPLKTALADLESAVEKTC